MASRSPARSTRSSGRSTSNARPRSRDDAHREADVVVPRRRDGGTNRDRRRTRSRRRRARSAPVCRRHDDTARGRRSAATRRRAGEARSRERKVAVRDHDPVAARVVNQARPASAAASRLPGSSIDASWSRPAHARRCRTTRRRRAGARRPDHLFGEPAAECARVAGSSASARRALPSAKARIGITTPVRASAARVGAEGRGTVINLSYRCGHGAEGFGDRRWVVGNDRCGDRQRGTPTTLWGRNPDVGRRDQPHAREPDLPRRASRCRSLCGPRLISRRRVPMPTSWSWRCRRTDTGRCCATPPGSSGATSPIVSVSKGVERDTLLRMSEVTLDVLPDHRAGSGRGAHRAEPRTRGRRGTAGGVGDRVPRRGHHGASSSSCS